MSIADPAHARHAEEERHREAPVHDAVVEDHVGDTEQRHSRARSDRNSGGDSMHVAPDHHERRRDGGMRGGQRVVGLEATCATAVVRAMNAPETMVPNATMEEARPGLHRGGHEDRHQHANRHRRCRAHEVTS
jgi:hypothetical protein